LHYIESHPLGDYGCVVSLTPTVIAVTLVVESLTFQPRCACPFLDDPPAALRSSVAR